MPIINKTVIETVLQAEFVKQEETVSIGITVWKHKKLPGIFAFTVSGETSEPAISIVRYPTYGKLTESVDLRLLKRAELKDVFNHNSVTFKIRSYKFLSELILSLA